MHFPRFPLLALFVCGAQLGDAASANRQLRADTESNANMKSSRKMGGETIYRFENDGWSLEWHERRKRDLRGIEDSYETIFGTAKDCGEVLAEYIPPELIQYVINGVVQKTETGSNSGYFEVLRRALRRDDITFIPKNGIQAVKLCSSCQLFQNVSRAGDFYDDYCGAGVYGSEAIVSGLLLLPVDRNREIFAGALKGAVWMRGLQADADKVYSNRFPSTPEFAAAIMTDLGFFYQLFDPIMTSSSGYVAVVADYLGYGRSSDYFRGTISKRTYLTSTIPLWLKAKDSVAFNSNYKSNLVNKAYVSGYSEGGYGTTVVANALKKLGVEILAAFPSAPTVRPQIAFSDWVGKHIEGNFVRYSYALALAGYAYASFNPNNDVAKGSTLLSEEYEQNAMKWIMGKLSIDEMRSLVLAVSDVSDPSCDTCPKILNSAVIKHFKSLAPGEKLCDRPGGIQSLCDALAANSLTDILDESDYPVSICHSHQDDMIPFEVLIPFTTNQNVTLIPSLEIWKMAADDGFTYTHATALPVCTLLQAFRIIA